MQQFGSYGWNLKEKLWLIFVFFFQVLTSSACTANDSKLTLRSPTSKGVQQQLVKFKVTLKVNAKFSSLTNFDWKMNEICGLIVHVLYHNKIISDSCRNTLEVPNQPGTIPIKEVYNLSYPWQKSQVFLITKFQSATQKYMLGGNMILYLVFYHCKLTKNSFS